MTLAQRIRELADASCSPIGRLEGVVLSRAAFDRLSGEIALQTRFRNDEAPIDPFRIILEHKSGRIEISWGWGSPPP